MSAHLAFQCVYGTLIDAYLKGYDTVLVTDAIATTTPEGALTNVLYNVRNVSSLILLTIPPVTFIVPIGLWIRYRHNPNHGQNSLR